MPKAAHKIIQNAYEKILKNQLKVLADSFYTTLWSKYPSSKLLFRTNNMQQQKEGFLKGIAFIIENLDRPEILEAYVDDMGIRHSAYGIRPEHYSWVGDALLTALEVSHTAQHWTPELANAWQSAFQKIAYLMQTGAEKVRMKRVAHG